MDQAWELEAALWAATTTGEVADFYAHTLTDDATIIIPGHRIRRDEMVGEFAGHAVPWSEYTISDREMLLVTPDVIVLTYRLVTSGPDQPNLYSAQVTSIYRQTAKGWALALRQHTPDAGVVADEWLPDTCVRAHTRAPDPDRRMDAGGS